MKSKIFKLSIGKGGYVSAHLLAPNNIEARNGLVLAHGLGNNLNHPLLESFATGLTKKGMITLRFNFPYRERGKDLPDPQETLVETLCLAFEWLKDETRLETENIFLAGKSLGGRIASLAVAEKLIVPAGIIFLGYPLHPPIVKFPLRSSHLHTIETPMLFFAGTRDSLCDLKLLESELKKIKAPWKLEIIEGGDHSFIPPAEDKRTELEIYQEIISRAWSWIESLKKL
ncbi:MAG: dienelactone hydrolase family protein [Syntrophales bacterium]|nr:dienelactone hydrolase family protein [Syntrophales bacterium]